MIKFKDWPKPSSNSLNYCYHREKLARDLGGTRLKIHRPSSPSFNMQKTRPVSWTHILTECAATTAAKKSPLSVGPRFGHIPAAHCTASRTPTYQKAGRGPVRTFKEGHVELFKFLLSYV
ncbi:hypothetical protein Zmor_026036 [Zophobas morio]|uniref:Uncharacterized protein n=1 Tax=Zophobas morio TaxID=2755281 RepID=A0AA38HV96_9CUCU|nr:hypothetical protein Zmor_026036 [Zophobas morio]